MSCRASAKERLAWRGLGGYDGAMLGALLKAIEQLPERRVRGAVVWSIGGTIAGGALLFGFATWLLRRVSFFEAAWLEWLTDIVGGLALITLLVVLFPAVVVAVAGFLTDGVARAVEAKHYPHAGPGRAQPIGEAVWNAVKFLAVVVAVNLIALPLYLLPGPNLIVFVAVNGYLMGREFFELVSVRHMSAAESNRLRRSRRGRVFVAGAVIALIGTLPVVNLVLPVLGTAFMVHVFHGARGA